MIPLYNKPNVDQSDPEYPLGAIKDNTGTNNGTPVNKLVYNDMHQFFEQLISQSLTTPNNLPDNETNGYQLMEALLKYIRTRFASATESGVTEIATQAEVDGGSDTFRYITPATLNATPIVMQVHGGVLLTTKVINIGDWNMDADNEVTITHGVTDYKKIRSIKAIIRNDADTVFTDLQPIVSTSGIAVGGCISDIGATTFKLRRFSAADITALGWGSLNSLYDLTTYDSTSFNRGWVTIVYET